MILAVAVMLLASVFPAKAADFEVDGIAYNITGENEVEVTKRTERYSGVVEIPAQVTQDGVSYQVTRIGSSAFAGSPELTLVDIPEGVTSIGSNAFYNCPGLEAVDFPGTLTSIGSNAFYCCSGITSLYIPRNLTDIARDALFGCCGIVSFSCSAFNPQFKVVGGVLYNKDMTMLLIYPGSAPATSFVVPSTVTALQYYAFRDCDNLTEITIPESVTWIGAAVFAYSDGLETVVLPDGITHMGTGTFMNCAKLSSIHLPASVDSLLSSTVSMCPLLKEVTIPRNVKYIGRFAFCEATGTERFIFEEGSQLETIEEMAFSTCPLLETFDMPNSVTTVGYDAFQKCTGLKTIHLSDNLINLANAVFWDCSSLTELVIPRSVVSIRNGLVTGCSSLKVLRIGDKYGIPGYTSVEHSAIGTASLEVIELGANVDSIPEFGFGTITGLKVFISWNPNPPKCVQYSIGFNTPFNTAVLYVPKASVEAYSTAVEWKRFKTIVPIEDVGDVNDDGFINISDAIALVNHLSVDGPVNGPLADMNLDGEINISDVIALINKLLNE